MLSASDTWYGCISRRLDHRRRDSLSTTPLRKWSSRVGQEQQPRCNSIPFVRHRFHPRRRPHLRPHLLWYPQMGQTHYDPHSLLSNVQHLPREACYSVKIPTPATPNDPPQTAPLADPLRTKASTLGTPRPYPPRSEKHSPNSNPRTNAPVSNLSQAPAHPPPPKPSKDPSSNRLRPNRHPSPPSLNPESPAPIPPVQALSTSPILPPSSRQAIFHRLNQQARSQAATIPVHPPAPRQPWKTTSTPSSARPRPPRRPPPPRARSSPPPQKPLSSSPSGSCGGCARAAYPRAPARS